MARISTLRKESFEDFKATLKEKYGESGIRFTEVGKHGWVDVRDVLDNDVTPKRGAHWCDASFTNPQMRRAGWLAGKYNFVTGVSLYWTSS